MSNTREVDEKIRKIPAVLLGEVKRVFDTESVLMGSRLQSRHLTGGTSDDRLGVRSGALRASVRALPGKVRGETVEGGVAFGTQYARTHVGPKGSKTTIKPKKPGGALTIPLKAALTPAGDLRAPATSRMWGETFIFKSRKGNAIIAGKKQITKGKRTGQYRQDIVPLFLLVPQVTIPARVHPEEIVAWEKPRLISALRKVSIRFRAGE